ncbi:hypothetical protein OAM52_03080 [Flavobacteriaceae bacterium]|nr:hypothetical protein [Flavobacteriaceae bacterium]
MPLKFYVYFSTILFSSGLYSQVGIGTPQPNPSSQLEVVAIDRGVLLPQVPLTSSTDTQTIINGNIESLLVYNTSTVLDITPGYYYWDGAKWNRLGNEPEIFTGNGAPTTNNPNSPSAGNIYVDEATGAIYTFDGTTWVNQSIGAKNGLSIKNNEIILGGPLTEPTTITTTNTNTLAIAGLENDPQPQEIVVVDPQTGTLKKTPVSNLFKEEVVLHIAQDGQLQFQTPLTISDPKKVNVYRNGVRIDFTTISATAIEIEQGAKCYKDDEIRIVQFN